MCRRKGYNSPSMQSNDGMKYREVRFQTNFLSESGLRSKGGALEEVLASALYTAEMESAYGKLKRYTAKSARTKRGRSHTYTIRAGWKRTKETLASLHACIITLRRHGAKIRVSRSVPRASQESPGVQERGP